MSKLILYVIISLIFCSTFANIRSRDFGYARYYQAQKDFSKQQQQIESKVSGFPCGENQEVHERWTNAQKRAEVIHGTAHEVVEHTMESIYSLRVPGDISTCIAFQVARQEGINQCQSLLVARDISDKQNKGSFIQISDWAENAAYKLEPWFRGYQDECGYILH